MLSTRRRMLQCSMLALSSLAIGRRSGLAADTPGPRKQLRILILGGTGFTGPYQVRYALARGHKVTLFNRGREHRDWPGEVEELVGDRNSGDLKALQGREWDVCIDNPTTLPFWVRDVGEVLHDKVRQYIFISTISVYAETDKPADESAAVAPYSGKDAMLETQETLRANTAALYGPLKALSEEESKKQFPGIATIIRAGLIVGPGDESDRFTYWPARIARGGTVLAPGDGSDPVQFIDARDLAEWTIRVAESRVFGVFNATGPAHPLTMRGFLMGVATAIGAKFEPKWVPATFLDKESVSPWTDMPVWVPGQDGSAGFARRDIRRALNAGLTYRPLRVTTLDTLEWFKLQPPERQAKLKAGVSAEREEQVLADWQARSAAHG
jgi:2'-hydroxyisoflavone reductase